MNVQNGVSADILYIGRGFSMERKYSYLDQLSIEQLEDLLRAQRDASSADKDTAFCEAIEEVILERETSHPTGRLSDVDDAWTEFQQHYNTPEGNGLALYPDDPDTECPPTPYTTPSPHFHGKHRIVRKILAVAAILAAIFAGMVAVQASGIDIFGTIARWTDETFRFASSATPTSFEANSNYVEAYGTVQELFAEYGMDESLIPGWIPSRYELIDIKSLSAANYNGIVLVFEDGSKTFSVFCANYKSEKLIDLKIFEKDASRVEKCIYNNRLFYLMENLGHVSGVWTNGKETIAISGDLDFDELKTIVAKIGD